MHNAHSNANSGSCQKGGQTHTTSMDLAKVRHACVVDQTEINHKQTSQCFFGVQQMKCVIVMVISMLWNLSIYSCLKTKYNQ